MAAGRANVGSVSVSVVPDATGFSTKLGAQIDPAAAALGRRLGQQISDDLTRAIRNGIQQGIVQGGAGVGGQGSRAGDDFGGSFARSLRTRLEAAFKSLPKVNIDANSSAADVKIASIREQLDELSRKRIGIDITDTEALEKLGLLHAQLEELSHNATSIQMKVDTTRAAAELAKLVAEIERVGAEDPTIKVDADTAGANAKLAETEGAASGAGSGFSGLIAAGIALGPALIPVIAAVTAAVLGLLSILGAGVIGVGVLALGFSGVIKGVTELDAVQNKAASSGRSAASSALAQAGAAQAIQQAEASLANTRASAASAAIRSAEQVKNAKAAEEQAEVTAAANTAVAIKSLQDARAAVTTTFQAAMANDTAAMQQLATAEHAVTAAQQGALVAEQALTQARQTAAQQAVDLANQLVDSQNAQRQAVLDVASAQTNLDTVNANPTATDQQRAQAQLTFDEAKQHLLELGIATQRLADQKAASDKAGADGSQVVIQAQAQLAAANDAVVASQDNYAKSMLNLVQVQKASKTIILDSEQAQLTAAKNLQQVQLQGAQAVTKAEQTVTDAIRSQSDQQRQSAFAIEQAVNAVASAHRSAASAALGGVPAISAQQSAFDRLSPAVQQFAHFVHDFLEPAFKSIQGAAAAGLLPGVEAAFKLLLPVLPDLAKFVGQVAKALGEMFLQGAKSLKDPFWRSFFEFVKTNAIPALQGIGQFLGDVAAGFAGLIQAFLPVTASVGDGILGLADNFAAFGEQAGKPGSPFQTFIGYVQTYGPQVASFFGDLFSLVGNLVTVFAPWGDILFQTIAYVTHLAAALGPSGLALVLGIAGAAILAVAAATFEATIPVIAIIAGVTLLAGAFFYMYQNIKPVHDFIDQHILPKFRELADYFTSTVLPVLKRIGGEALLGIQGGIQIVAKAIDDNRPQLDQLYKSFKQAAEYIVEHVLPVLGPILKTAFEVAGVFIANFITSVSLIVTAFEAVSAAAQGNWDMVHQYISQGIHSVIGLINDFIGALNSIPGINIPLIPNGAAYTAPTKHTDTGGHGKAFAGGGVLPGYTPGVDSIRALLSPGEGILVPEAVRLLGPDWVYRVNHIASGGRAPMPPGYAGGGIIGDVTGAASGIVNTVTGIGSGIANAALGPLIHKAESVAKSLINSQLPAGLFRDMADGAVDLIGGAFHFSAGGIAGPASFTAVPAGGGSADSLHQTLTIENHHRPLSPAGIVQGWNIHLAAHGQPLLAGSGFGG